MDGWTFDCSTRRWMNVCSDGRLDDASTSISVADAVDGSSGTPGVVILVGVVGGDSRDVDGLSTTITAVALAASVPKKREERNPSRIERG